MKKLLALLLTCAMVLSLGLLASCGQTDPGDANGDSQSAAETDGQKLAGMMIGKELTESHYEKVDASGREIVAELDHVDYNKESKHSGLADLSLRIHAGEIVGVAGVDGNGQTPKSPAFNEAFNAAGSPWQLLVQNAVWGSGDLKADNKAVTDVLSAQ